MITASNLMQTVVLVYLYLEVRIVFENDPVTVGRRLVFLVDVEKLHFREFVRRQESYGSLLVVGIVFVVHRVDQLIMCWYHLNSIFAYI